MKTDKVVDGVLIEATQPEEGQPYEWPDGVTTIGDGAFYNWKNFNQPFSIPEGVTKIGYGAFYNWDSFNQPFSIPESVTSIGDGAFYNWNSFNQPFSLPASVTKIGKYAFSNWTSFNQPNSHRTRANSDLLRIDNWVFAGYYSGKLEQLRNWLDSGKSTPEREDDWKIISKPFPC